MLRESAISISLGSTPATGATMIISSERSRTSTAICPTSTSWSLWSWISTSTFDDHSSWWLTDEWSECSEWFDFFGSFPIPKIFDIFITDKKMSICCILVIKTGFANFTQQWFSYRPLWWIHYLFHYLFFFIFSDFWEFLEVFRDDLDVCVSLYILRVHWYLRGS